MIKCEVKWQWSSWTFGIWWGRFRKHGPNHIGIDLGPLNILWAWPATPRKVRHDSR